MAPKKIFEKPEKLISIDRLEIQFVEQYHQLEEVLEETCYFLRSLPNSRALQPHGKDLAQRLREKFEWFHEAAKEARARKDGHT